jgi:hypothetical protein
VAIDLVNGLSTNEATVFDVANKEKTTLKHIMFRTAPSWDREGTTANFQTKYARGAELLSYSLLNDETCPVLRKIRRQPSEPLRWSFDAFLETISPKL